MYPGQAASYARERRLSIRDAAQVFMQVIVLRHVSEPQARLMGGTALALGHGSPRFSEDVDFIQVSDPERLGPGLKRAGTELEGWFAASAAVSAPKSGRTWRLTMGLGRSETLRLHVDSQPFKAHTARPIVIEYPSVPAFVFPALEVDEIMAEKVIAVATRRYLGGRDLFDLWFHWLRSPRWESRTGVIMDLFSLKLRERSLEPEKVASSISSRLSERMALTRARREWTRYLPADFQKPAVLGEIVETCRLLGELFR
jgi:predicted nucleotidyltransferase component of viral defense system